MFLPLRLGGSGKAASALALARLKVAPRSIRGMASVGEGCRRMPSRPAVQLGGRPALTCMPSRAMHARNCRPRKGPRSNSLDKVCFEGAVSFRHLLAPCLALSEYTSTTKREAEKAGNQPHSGLVVHDSCINCGVEIEKLCLRSEARSSTLKTRFCVAYRVLCCTASLL